MTIKTKKTTLSRSNLKQKLIPYTFKYSAWEADRFNEGIEHVFKQIQEKYPDYLVKQVSQSTVLKKEDDSCIVHYLTFLLEPKP
jgi:hypothetical protein